MATRLYFNESQNGAVNLGAQVGSVWESNIHASIGVWPTKKASTTPDGNTNTSHNATIGNGTNPNDVLAGQFMTDLIAAGVTISGSVRGTICIRESSTNMELYTQVGLFVVNGTTGALLGTLLAGANSGGTEANNPSANTREIPRNGSTAISSYGPCDGSERVVIEIGWRLETTRTGDNAYMYFGAGTSGSDLPAGDGSSNSLTARPWIEFTANLFTSPALGKSRAAVAMGALPGLLMSRRQDGLHVPGGRRSPGGVVLPG